ncbi:MAG: efflux RND transporter periplasmic adaptor subunit [Desulfuromonas sp.]|nr:MAG: efflux RND transporter periplasmic adaptor subunit [Desulfuromonas sp.]
MRYLLFLLTFAIFSTIALPLTRTALTATVQAAEDAEKFTCGMHPMVVVDEPGLCPICQMDLTPLTQGKNNKSAGQIIEIDAITSQKMAIRTSTVTRRNMVRTVHTVGVADYEEPGQHAVNSKVSGWVEKLHVNQTGQSVNKGDTLLDLYSPELVAAQSELLLALKNMDKMEQSGFSNAERDALLLLESARKRLQLWDISQEQITALETSGQVQKTLTILAPASGIVSKKLVREGEFIQAGRELLEISDISKIWVYAYIYEYEVPWVKVGQEANLTFPFPHEPISGRIDRIYPYLDKRSRTIRVRIALDNSNLRLKPDMYADVEIMTESVQDKISIPAESVLYTGKHRRVFVDLGDGHFEPRRITTGLNDDSGYVEILDGLQEGEQVVTSAQFMLDSESKLREALQKMLTPEVPSEPEENLDDLF